MSVKSCIRAEQLEVDRALEAGATHVVNRAHNLTNRVHTLMCSHARDRLDRTRAWELQSEYWHAPYQVAEDDAGCYDRFGPKMPMLMSRSEIEDLRAYRACRTCKPLTDHPVKTPRRTIMVRNLGDRHFGLELILVGDVKLGILERIATERVPGDFRITLHTSTGAHELAAAIGIYIPVRKGGPAQNK